MRRLIYLLMFFLATTGLVGNALADQPDEEETPTATISGQIMIAPETPMPHGIVLLFDSMAGPPPSMGKYWRVPDLIIPLEQDGRFTFEVDAGTYYLQASQKNPNAEIGPAVEKEYFYFHGDADGKAIPLTVTAGANLDLGKLKAFLWTPDMVQRDKGVTSVEGVVVDPDGKPVERALVLAYYSPEGQGRRPVFISDRTDKQGRYQLRTDGAGTFYLKVRSVVGGGKPSSGEYLNTTKEFEPVKVTLKKGEKLKNVTLTVVMFTRIDQEVAPLERREWKVLEGQPGKDGE